MRVLIAGFIFAISSMATIAAEALATGTGFFVTSDGFFVTNHHVVEGAVRIVIRDTSGNQFPAVLVRVDKSNDLALLRARGKFKAIPVAGSQGVRRGDRIFTLGFPNILVQGIEAKYTEGVISSLSGLQDEPNSFQITVPLQPGNSGGPLVSRQGNAIGVITGKLSAAAMLKRGSTLPENVNFAVKSNYLLELLATVPLARQGLVPIRRDGSRAMGDVAEQIESAIGLVVVSTQVGASDQAARQPSPPVQAEPPRTASAPRSAPIPQSIERPVEAPRASVAPAAPPVQFAVTQPRIVSFETIHVAYGSVSPYEAPITHLLVLNVALLTRSGWTKNDVKPILERTARILVKCGIGLTTAHFHEYEVPDRMLDLDTPTSRELARALNLPVPIIFLGRGTRHNPGFEGEAFGRGNVATRPEMRNSVWINYGATDSGVLLARLLTFVLRDSPSRSDAQDNLHFGDRVSPDRTALSLEQCLEIKRTGTQQGLLSSLR